MTQVVESAMLKYKRLWEDNNVFNLISNLTPPQLPQPKGVNAQETGKITSRVRKGMMKKEKKKKNRDSIFNSFNEQAFKVINDYSVYQLLVKYKDLKHKFGCLGKDIWFNMMCKKQDIIPNYIYKKICYRNWGYKLRRKIMTLVLNNELSDLYRVRDCVGYYVYKIRTRLVGTLHPLEWDVFDYSVRCQLQQPLADKHTRLENKLRALTRQQQQSHTSFNNNNEHISFHERVVNLTDIEFTANEIQLLRKGLKYCPVKRIERNQLINLIASLDCTNIADSVKLNCAQMFMQFMKSQENAVEFNHTEDRTLKKLLCKINKHNVIIVKADKGNAVVLMSRQLYIEKTLEFIQSTDCVLLKKDPTSKYDKVVKDAVTGVQWLFTEFEKLFLVQMNPSTPRLYSLPKIHKDDVPVRAIVSTTGSPCAKLSKKLNGIFKQITNFKAKYTYKDRFDVVKELKNLHLTGDEILVSFDIVNLFSSVPVDEVISLMKEMVLNLGDNQLVGEELVSLVELCFSQNYFKFNGSFYRQDRGLAMGSSLSPLAADIFLDYFENNFICNPSNPYYDQIVLWGRYVDDCLCVWRGRREALTGFLERLNFQHPNISFTMELEQNGRLPYLDLLLKRGGNQIEFGIYRKETATDILIPNSSNHHPRQKITGIQALIHRLEAVPLSPEEYDKELATINFVAQENGFPNKMVASLLHKKRRKRMLLSLHPPGPDNSVPHTNWCSLPYYGSISARLGKILEKEGVRVAFKSGPSLGHLLTRVKDPMMPEDSSGIYKIECFCGAAYIGQTGRKLGQRLKEHFNRGDSKFKQHILHEGHINGPHKFSLIHRVEKGAKMNSLEAIEIAIELKKGGRSLNARSEVSSRTPIMLFLGSADLSVMPANNPVTVSAKL